MVLKKILAFFVYKGIIQKISESLTIRNAARLSAHIYFKGRQVIKLVKLWPNKFLNAYINYSICDRQLNMERRQT